MLASANESVIFGNILHKIVTWFDEKVTPLLGSDFHFLSCRFLLKNSAFWHEIYLFLKFGVGSPGVGLFANTCRVKQNGLTIKRGRRRLSGETVGYGRCLVYNFNCPNAHCCVDPGAYLQAKWSAHHFFFSVCKVSVWAGNHKFSSSVMSGSFKSMFGVLHRLDLGLTSHPNDVALPHLVTHISTGAPCPGRGLNPSRSRGRRWC